jgi:Rrf2 family protein
MAQRPDQPQKVREIAEGTRAAPGYLVKVLQSLTKAEILSAQRGSQGGFTLRRSAESLSVLEVINAIDPIERITTCPLGLESHGTHLCPMHKQIDEGMGAIQESFSSSTIQDLLNTPSRSRPLCNGLSVTQPKP